MALATSCIALCAPLTAIASVLLFMMAHMLRSGNWTFEVLAAKHNWNSAEKADVCRRGAVLYLVTSLTLWLVMLLQAPLQHLWLRLPWRRRQRYSEERLARAVLLGAEERGSANASTAGGGTASTGGGREVNGGSRRLIGATGVATGEATELSALDWGQGGMSPARHIKSGVVTSGSSPLAGRGPEAKKNGGGASPVSVSSGGGTGAGSGALSPSGRRFPDFLRSLASGNADAPEAAREDAQASSAVPVEVAWGRARGLRSRAQPVSGETAELPGSVTIRADFFGGDSAQPTAALHGDYTSVQSLQPFYQSQQQQQQQHATLWNSGGDADSTNDSEFMSDVEFDDNRHSGLRQLRASGWGMRRSAGGPLSRSGAGGRGPAVSNGSHGSTSSGRERGNGGGAAPLLTTLWPAQSSSSQSSSPSGRQRGFSSGGPPPAMQRDKNRHL